MALWTQASDITTKQTIWVAQNVVKGRPQLNSHSSECYNREQIDGYEAWDIAGLYTDYVGNDWQSKHVEFLKKWEQW